MYYIENFTILHTGDVDVTGVILKSRVLWCDIDHNQHMNNARYLRELNYSRRHFFVSIGLWPLLRRQGLNLIVASQCIRYRKELKLFMEFHIRTRILAWSDVDRCFWVESTFERGGFVCAIHHVKYVLVGDKTITPSALLRQAKVSLNQQSTTGISSIESDLTDDSHLPPFIQAWKTSHDISSKELNPKKNK
jgi:acyl-CoA thioesterase FadM